MLRPTGDGGARIPRRCDAGEQADRTSSGGIKRDWTLLIEENEAKLVEAYLPAIRR